MIVTVTRPNGVSTLAHAETFMDIRKLCDNSSYVGVAYLDAEFVLVYDEESPRRTQQNLIYPGYRGTVVVCKLKEFKRLKYS